MDGVLICGNLNIDRILSVDYLPGQGQSTPVNSQRVEFGGCGGNLSISLAKLETPVYLSSVVGKDFDQGYLRSLKEHGVDLKNLIIDPDLPSPFCIVLSAPNGEQAYAFMMGAMEKQEQIKPEFILDGPIKFCHIATSHPHFSLKTASAMKKMGISTSFDPGQEIYFRWKGPEVSKVLKRCDRFFGNLGEWEYLLDILEIEWDERRSDGIIYPWSDSIFDMIDEAVVTLGSKGSMLLRNDEVIVCPPVEVEGFTDATGAGDSYRGGYYSALGRGFTSEEALRFGNGMGALSITSPGPQGYKASWKELVDLVEK